MGFISTHIIHVLSVHLPALLAVQQLSVLVVQVPILSSIILALAIKTTNSITLEEPVLLAILLPVHV